MPPVETFIAHVLTALRQGTFVRLLLSKPVTGATPCERIIGRLVRIRGEDRLSLTLREPRRDTTRNLPIDDVAAWLAGRIDGEFRSAVLETTEKSWQLLPSPDGRTKLAAHRSTQQTPPSREHDRNKPGFLDPSAQPWMQALGLCGSDGKVRASMADKHRQLERYVEIFAHLATDCRWQAGDRVTVADMGCGKGYLTFGVWHLLNRHLRLEARVIGIEARSDLVDRANHIAQEASMDGLRFQAGTIAATALPEVDAFIALHACNTATDDAIRRGLAAKARLILTSPCCHQEVRPQLGRPEPLSSILAHGIMAERFSEWLTDGLRTLHLERAGYATKIIEFVGSEHTPRNLLIAAVRRDTPQDAAARARLTAEIARLRDWSGISHHALDDLLAGE